jgi:hypothetical protein
VLSLLLAGSASAGYFEVVYDLTGSTMTTTAAGWTDVDPITGTWTIRYGATASTAPLTSALLVAGNQYVAIDNRPFGIFTITGFADTDLNPATGGSPTPGTLTGNTLNLSVVTFADSVGYLHCYPNDFWCGLATLAPASVQHPQSQTGPFTIPPLIFATTAGFGNFTGSRTMTTTVPAAQMTFSYVGTEISRIYVVPEPATSSMAALGLAGLAGLNWYTRKQRR